jgi:Bacteriophage baseplate protein W
MNSESFIGRGWGFPPQFISPQSGPVMVSAEEEIRQAIRILITTAVGERIMHPRFGCGLSSFLFEGVNFAVLADLKEELRNVILLAESRVDIEGISVDFLDQENGQLAIDIQYSIRETNTRSNLVFPFYLTEFKS